MRSIQRQSSEAVDKTPQSLRYPPPPPSTLSHYRVVSNVLMDISVNNIMRQVLNPPTPLSMLCNSSCSSFFAPHASHISPVCSPLRGPSSSCLSPQQSASSGNSLHLSTRSLSPPCTCPAVVRARDSHASVSWILRHIVFPALKDKIKGKKSDEQLQ